MDGVVAQPSRGKRLRSDRHAPRVSIVVPLLNEEENIAALWRRLRSALNPLGQHHYEVVFVDDGSRDSTPHLLDRLCERHPQIVVVHLSRNFGHQAAVSAGLEHARGKSVVVMDGDLQDPPELIPDLMRRLARGI